jgi:hypothetical protein
MVRRERGGQPRGERRDAPGMAEEEVQVEPHVAVVARLEQEVALARGQERAEPVRAQ